MRQTQSLREKKLDVDHTHLLDNLASRHKKNPQADHTIYAEQLSKYLRTESEVWTVPLLIRPVNLTFIHVANEER